MTRKVTFHALLHISQVCTSDSAEELPALRMPCMQRVCAAQPAAEVVFCALWKRIRCGKPAGESHMTLLSDHLLNKRRSD